jgi:HAD superfamily hydrolase (TIGR01509 family)
MQFQTYLFDWDGTLADTLSVWLKTYRRVFDQLDLPITDKEIGQQVFGNLDYWTQHGLEQHLDLVRAEEEKAYAAIQTIDLNSGARELFEKLTKQGVVLGIVTTAARENIESALKRHQISQYFSTLVCGTDTVKHKPDPEPVLIALENLHADPKSTVMIGDTDKDINAGRAAGVHTILLEIPGYHDVFYKEDMVLSSQPEFIVHSLAEIK